MKLFIQIIRYIGIYLVAFILMSFAISKFYNAQFQIFHHSEFIPLGELPRFWHAWSFFGRSYEYNFFIGISEFIAAFAILFSRTRLIGLLIAFGIYINIIFIDILFDVTNAIVQAIIGFSIVLMLLFPYLSDLKKFFWDMSGSFSGASPQNKWLNQYVPWIFTIVVFISVSILLNNVSPVNDKNLRGFKINHFELDGDTLNLTGGTYTKDPMLFFEFSQTCMLSINGKVYGGRYQFENDSVSIFFRNAPYNINQINGKLTNNENLTGLANDQMQLNMALEPVERKYPN